MAKRGRNTSRGGGSGRSSGSTVAVPESPEVRDVGDEPVAPVASTPAPEAPAAPVAPDAPAADTLENRGGSDAEDGPPPPHASPQHAPPQRATPPRAESGNGAAAAPPAPAPAQSPAAAAQQQPAAPAPPQQPAAVPHEQPPLLFEVAWEVCWQLGGIYTVLRTKAAAMLETWGDRYCLIGPYNPATAAVEFEEQPTYGSVRDTIQRLRDSGLPCYFGRWLVSGRPRVILIDHRARYGNLHVDKYLMWQDHHIAMPDGDGEVNDVVAFGFAVAEFFRVFTEVVRDRPILAHFHEWMGGVAVPRIAHLRLPVATIFTTHATLLGRYLASDNPHFYQQLWDLDPDKEATRYNIYPRHAIERAAAHASTVFTTVSDVTGIEAAKLLGRRADVILPNGLNIHRFAAPHEFQHWHSVYKERIHEFVMGHFFPSYNFDLDNTVYLFTAGRYEYRNKGMDLFIEALHRLNQRLKHEVVDPPTVVAFIITRAMVRHVNVETLRSQSMFDDLRNTCDEIAEQMRRRLFYAAAHGRLPTSADLLPEDSTVRLKRSLSAWKSHRQPLIVTHDLADDAGDPTLKHLRHRHLFNAADDPVKVVFHPEFVSATSPVISLDYDQFVRGCHMGIFPSYYEPWGYTPMECVALGLPAVTTDLSGFGAYVQRHIPDHDGQGIIVLNRRDFSFEESTDHLVEYLLAFLRLTRRQRIEMRNKVERLGETFDWATLVKHYAEAHNLALERTGARKMGTVEVRVV